jgi:hypothetical protein
VRLSVKQISMFGARERSAFGSCPRKWGFAYLDKEKPAYLAPQLVDGIKFHHCIATLVMTGRMPEPGELQPGVVLTAEECLPEGNYGRMARAAIVLLPHERGWIAEGEYLVPWTTKHGVSCEIDVRPDLWCNGEVIDLIDWKSTGNLRNAVPSLADDIQANVYAYGLLTLSGAEQCQARWIYVEKKTYSTGAVPFVFSRAGAEAWLHAHIDPTNELITAFRDAGMLALDLPADEEACGGVGRWCDHMAKCFGPVGPKPARLISLEEIVRYKEG